VADIRQASVFGRRKEPHTIIIARGDSVRHFTVRPWVAAFVGSALAALAIGYLVATSYLVFRDDLLGATIARQARMQQSYEDRISALRAQVDRITSRQLLDQQLVESKVTELLERQSQLTSRQDRLAPVLERMGTRTGGLPGAAPVPTMRPDQRAELSPSSKFTMASLWQPGPHDSGRETAADRADRMFVALNQSLRTIESEQIGDLTQLAGGAFETADAIAEAMREAGLTVEIDEGANDAVGGPLLPVSVDVDFDARVRELDEALAKLESVKARASAVPIHNPAPGRSISSSFGVRRDPLLRTPAMHAGIDFRTPTGTPILSAGAGTVIRAGWAGGYGRMVEIDHGDGLTTRYAHMSRLKVSKGQRIETGVIVGEAGSSGRSTGPHLHYEVRRNGKAIDPLRLIKAGKRIQKLM
jgi:murein DD-endopeptidase MepM/ murein hydrolase activator NlpD